MPTSSATGQPSRERELDSSGAFVRQPYVFRGRITRDGSSGYPAVPGRYHLYVSHACPWASRAVIVRRLLGLEAAVPMTVVDPVRDERGWAFRAGPGHSEDPVNGFQFLSEAYLATDPGYDLRVTVPVLWDRQTSRIVSNDFQTIDVDLATQFDPPAGRGVELYPAGLRSEIDEVSVFVYENATTASTGRGSPGLSRPTRRPSTRCSSPSTPSSGGSRRRATSWATVSRWPTSACSRRSCASTPSTTTASSAICGA